MKLYDITRPIAPGIAVWPGDQPFTSAWTAQIGDESVVNVGCLTMSTHTGTHIDAPLHFIREGKAIESFPLTHFAGRASVIEILSGDVVEPRHLQGIDVAKSQRVLFKTRSSLSASQLWTEDFVYIAPETVRYCGENGIVLIGTDAPSVDPADSKELLAHRMLAAFGIANIENLHMRDVPPGEYELIALPLYLPGMDAAPVRAVLIER